MYKNVQTVMFNWRGHWSGEQKFLPFWIIVKWWTVVELFCFEDSCQVSLCGTASQPASYWAEEAGPFITCWCSMPWKWNIGSRQMWVSFIGQNDNHHLLHHNSCVGRLKWGYECSSEIVSWKAIFQLVSTVMGGHLNIHKLECNSSKKQKV